MFIFYCNDMFKDDDDAISCFSLSPDDEVIIFCLHVALHVIYCNNNVMYCYKLFPSKVFIDIGNKLLICSLI